MRINLFFAILCVAFLVISCAQPRPVTGGPKDETPPQIVASVPQNFSTNFVGNSFMLEFDEYVQVKALGSELVVSPPLKNPLEYKIKGKRIYFTLKDTLFPETTYNFNFGNAIVDLNEGNPLDSNLFVVSTGDQLDSGTLSGIVRDAYTMNPSANTTIVVFSSSEDSAIYKGDPVYISKTDKNGRYNLNYMSIQDYKVYALEAPGPKYNYQPFSKVGFFPAHVVPTAADTINLVLFQEVDTTQFLSKDFSREYYEFVLSFNSPLQKPSFSFIPTSDTVSYIIQEIESDSFKFWIEGDRDVDTVTVFIADETGFSDTVKIDIDDRKQFYKKLKREDKETSPVQINLNTTDGVFHYFDSLEMRFSRPLHEWNPEKIWFADGKDTTRLDSLLSASKISFEPPFSQQITGPLIQTTPIIYEWKPSSTYAFIFYPGAFSDVINQTNDTTTLRFKTLGFEDYGSFRFTVKVPNYEGPLLLDLLNENDKFIRSYVVRSGNVIFHPLVVPGKYKFRMIMDENGNHKWDTGKLQNELLPEHIVYYDGIIEIRPNWDMEETWQIQLKF